MTIQFVMLVLLGFLIATLIALLLAPAFWSRAVRLTTERLRQTLPATEAEILADKDQLRAKYAVRVRQLEKLAEQSSLATARQRIELNRRDARIADLEAQVSTLQSGAEESENARRVLEQTVGDRIPKIEARLEEARKLLMIRDQEIADLNGSARRQQEALGEARAINQRQAGEIDRLRTQLMAADAQSRKGLRDADQEGDLALRTEVEVLRARVGDQASLIERLNAEVSAARSNSRAAEAGVADAAATSAATAAGVELEQLRGELDEWRRGVRRPDGDLAGAVAASAGGAAALEAELKAFKARSEDQAAEIVRLNSELAALKEAGEGRGAPSLRDNRIAMKARTVGLEAKISQQADTIQRLRSELAQANERAARQVASLREEMRRLGVGTHVTQTRGRSADAARARSVARRTMEVLDAEPSSAQATAGERLVSPAAARPAAATGASGSAASNGEAAAGGGAGRIGNLVALLRGDTTREGTQGPERLEVSGAAGSGDPVWHVQGGAGADEADREAGAGKRRGRLIERLTASQRGS